MIPQHLAVAALLFAVADVPARSVADRPEPAAGSTLPTDGNSSAEPVCLFVRTDANADELVNAHLGL